MSAAVSFSLSGQGATFAEKFEIFPLALPFALFFVLIGELIVGLPVLALLRSRNLDGNIFLLVVCGFFGGCVYAVLVTLIMAGGIPSTSGDMQFFFGLGGGLGALGGALWWALAQRKSQQAE